MKEKTYRQRWLARGLCGNCGGHSVRPGKTTCSSCAESMRSYQRKRRAQRRADGKCSSCASPLLKGTKAATCPPCIRHQRPSKQRSYARLKTETFAAYGTICACCGEGAEEFLAIDHIYGRDRKNRPEDRLSGAVLYAYLRRRNYPQGKLRVLCHNCNFARGKYGYCPHSSSIVGL